MKRERIDRFVWHDGDFTLTLKNKQPKSVHVKQDFQPQQRPEHSRRRSRSLVPA